MVRSDVLAVPLDDGLVLYDPVNTRAHVLNRSAAHLWGVLRAPVSINAAVAVLVDGSGADTEAVEHDVRAAIEVFAAEELLGPTPLGAGPTPLGAGPTPLRERLEVDGEQDRRAVKVALLDRVVAITSKSAEVIQTLDWFSAPTRSREPAGEGYELTLDPGELRTLPSRLNRLAAASTAFVVLHAAGVVFGDAAVALPAGPGAGKSTLATQLVGDGAGYLTDEVLGIAPGSLAVAGYPKRITLELGSWPLFPELERMAAHSRHDGLDPTRVRWVDARDLHSAAFAWRGRAVRLALVVVPRYEPGAEVNVERLLAVDAIVELLSDCFNLGVMGDIGLEALRDVAIGVPCYRVVHGDARQAAAVVRELAVAHGVAP